MNDNHTQKYAHPAIAAHWIIALLIISGFCIGLAMADMPLSPLKLKLFSYHKWIGMTVLALFLPRLLIRLAKRPPAALPAPAWQQQIASLTHLMLYILMLAVPLSGWLMSSAKGFPVVYLGLFPIPDLIDKNANLAEFLVEVHETLNYVLLVLVGLHVAAAIKHHVIDKDATLRRMSPFSK